MTFQRTLLTLTSIALGLGTATQSQAAIIVTFPTPSTTGSIVVTNDIAFTVTTTADDAIAVVFDEWVTSDGVRNSFAVTSITPALSYSLNNGSTQTISWTAFIDNFAANVSGLSANDGYFNFEPISLAAGDIFTLKAATYTLAAGILPATFNPQVAQTFTGNAFLVRQSAARLSANVPVGAVPEPSTAALGALAGLTLLRRRR